MSALAEARTASRDIPADIDVALASPGWRRHVTWPVSLAEANRVGSGQMRVALHWVAKLDDPLLRDSALLALPVILSYARAIVLAALAVSRAARSGARLVGTAPELIYLQGGEGPLPARTDPTLPPEPFRFPLLRRLARMRTWSGLTRLPRALLAPDAIAVSHNQLLRAVAANSRQAIGFSHAELILDAARRRSATKSVAADCGSDLAKAIMSDIALIDEPYRRRAFDLIEAMARPHLKKADLDMAALRSAPLPNEIWTGSGGLYAPRAVGLEVLRRGGRVRRFDHGTPREFVATVETTTLLELAVSSDFVLATEGAAQICRDELDENLLSPLRSIAIHGADGDPVFTRVPARRVRGLAGERLRVVYAPTQLLGFRQLVPALPPDVVHLDWQMRVAEALQALPVDFICQAHPEGLFKNRPHPLEKVATTIRGDFLRQLQSADVFIFDCPTTTALWEVACTDAHIVYLDMGAGTMTPKVAKLFAERATVIPIIHDENNRPVLDPGALRRAVLDDSAKPDPTAFRRLLAGAL
jgi:hypothetical protein